MINIDFYKELLEEYLFMLFNKKDIKKETKYYFFMKDRQFRSKNSQIYIDNDWLENSYQDKQLNQK